MEDAVITYSRARATKGNGRRADWCQQAAKRLRRSARAVSERARELEHDRRSVSSARTMCCKPNTDSAEQDDTAQHEASTAPPAQDDAAQHEASTERRRTATWPLPMWPCMEKHEPQPGEINSDLLSDHVPTTPLLRSVETTAS